MNEPCPKSVSAREAAAAYRACLSRSDKKALAQRLGISVEQLYNLVSRATGVRDSGDGAPHSS